MRSDHRTLGSGPIHPLTRLQQLAVSPMANPLISLNRAQKVGTTDGRLGQSIRVWAAVIRGGGWHTGPGCTPVWFRNALPPNWVDFAVGFRCARDVDED